MFASILFTLPISMFSLSLIFILSLIYVALLQQSYMKTEFILQISVDLDTWLFQTGLCTLSPWFLELLEKHLAEPTTLPDDSAEEPVSWQPCPFLDVPEKVYCQ